MTASEALAFVLLIWYAIILIVATLGHLCIRRKFRAPPRPNSPLTNLEPVTIIRPIKGIDPELLSCLELSFLQNYPHDKFQILFCVGEATDPAIPILEMLVNKYPDIDAQILISGQGKDYYGPNPKVNNLAKGFLRAAYDLLWIMDLNVWASPDVLANLVLAMANNTNCGDPVSKLGREVRLVHHVPLALAVNGTRLGMGSLLDEMFLFTSHSKFYVSLNNLSIAPCVNGKSNMYRRSDLDHAVSQIPYHRSPFFQEDSVRKDAARITAKGPGHLIEFFAKYIGEDNMIGIALWEYAHGRTALTGDLVIQPLMSQDQSNSIGEYINRRVRWLRVRKYMVKAATLIEPSTESIICGIIGTLALSRLLWGQIFNVYFFIFHMICWVSCDYSQYKLWVQNIHKSGHQPLWLSSTTPFGRDWKEWSIVWLMRELLALPIWIIAIAGHEINWRGKPFMIKKDLSAEAL